MHLSWFVVPMLAPVLVWGLGRWIGSTFLRQHGAVAANAHLTVAGLGILALVASKLEYEARSDTLGGLVVAAGFASLALLVILLLARSVEAFLAAAAATRGEIRSYVATLPLLRP